MVAASGPGHMIDRIRRDLSAEIEANLKRQGFGASMEEKDD